MDVQTAKEVRKTLEHDITLYIQDGNSGADMKQQYKCNSDLETKVEDAEEEREFLVKIIQTFRKMEKVQAELTSLLLYSKFDLGSYFKKEPKEIPMKTTIDTGMLMAYLNERIVFWQKQNDAFPEGSKAQTRGAAYLDAYRCIHEFCFGRRPMP